MVSRRDTPGVLVSVALITLTLAACWAAILLNVPAPVSLLIPVPPAAGLAWWVSARLQRHDPAFRRREVDAARALAAAADPSLVSAAPSEPSAGEFAPGGLTESIARSTDSLLAAAGRLRAQRDLVTTALDAVESVVIATDASGRVVVANASALRFFGDRPGTPVGRLIDELFTQHELVGLHAAAGAPNAAAAPLRAQIKIAVRGEMRVYQAAATPIATPTAGAASGRGGVALVLRDVTEFASAVQNRTDFVANASHEFRTPLSSIRAAVETLSDSAKEDPVMTDRLIQMIAGNVTRLEDLTRDMLDLSRLESPDAPADSGPVNMFELAETLVAHFEQACVERGLRIEFDLDPGLARMESDARLLQLVLRNLIDNATKFANRGSAVRIVGRVVTPEQGGPITRRHAARFQVIDQGMGIPLAAQRRIFERFYQVDASRSGQASRRGTGLGLAIVKSSVKALGGTIGVESIWKQGTTMTVDLPACVAVEEPAPRP